MVIFPMPVYIAHASIYSQLILNTALAVSLADGAGSLLLQPLVNTRLVELVTAVQTTQSSTRHIVFQADGTPSVPSLG